MSTAAKSLIRLASFTSMKEVNGAGDEIRTHDT